MGTPKENRVIGVNKMNNYGKELILDLHECSTENFNRLGLIRFFNSLCKLIDMEAADLHFWDYEDEPELYKKAPAHLKGTSAVQFIMTSNITVHTLDDLKRIYINIFSCKEFIVWQASKFAQDYFKGTIVNEKAVIRK